MIFYEFMNIQFLNMTISLLIFKLFFLPKKIMFIISLIHLIVFQFIVDSVFYLLNNI